MYTEERRYHALALCEPLKRLLIEYRLVVYISDKIAHGWMWEKENPRFYFETNAKQHQASQIEVKRILNWQNALDIVLTPFEL